MMHAATSQAELLRLRALPQSALWVMAARLKTLPLSLTPVAVGSWWAATTGGWSLAVTLVAMAAAALIQIGTNLWNDAADGSADGLARLGPARMTGLGLLDVGQVRFGAGLVFAGAALLGLWLAYIGGPVIIVIGLVSLALGYFYSMGPHPLSHTPLGEALVVLFFGVVAVAGTIMLHGQVVQLSGLMLGAITGLPAAAILLLNNHRDRVQDTASGRRTLAIRIGTQPARWLFAALLTAAWIGGAVWGYSCALGLLALLPAGIMGLWLSVAMLRTAVSSKLNRLIARTAGFQLLLLVGMAVAQGICAA